jgi:hypothetical protein
VGAVAKGVRRTKSRFGGRLEPFSHVELSIHRGRGELGTVTGASLVRSHDAIRIDPYRLQVGLVGLEAMLRLYTEEERNDRAFLALTRFLDALDARAPQPGRRPALDPLVLSFQLKLLWLEGFLPHLENCVECGAEQGIVAFNTMPTAEMLWRGGDLPRGVFRDVCHVPANLLNDGVHWIELLVLHDNSRIILRQPDALVFEVHDSAERLGAWYGDWAGAVRPLLRWTSELVEELPADREAGTVVADSA